MLQNLSIELLIRIFSNLSASRDVFALSMTCKQTSLAANDPLVWTQIWRQYLLDEPKMPQGRRKQQGLYFKPYNQFLSALANRLGYHFVCRALHSIYKRKQVYFWDDLEILSFRYNLNGDQSLPLTALTKVVVRVFLKSKNEDIWQPSLDQIETLAIIYSSRPKIYLEDLIGCLIQVAGGPINSRRIGKSMPLSTSTLSEICVLHDRYVSLGPYDPSATNIKSEVDDLARHMDSRNEDYQYGSRRLFGCSTGILQKAVLRVILTLLQTCRRSRNSSRISTLLKESFGRCYWRAGNETLMALVRKKVDIDQYKGVDEKCFDRRDFFDFSVSPEKMARQLTHSEHLMLKSLYLDEYVDEFLHYHTFKNTPELYTQFFQNPSFRRATNKELKRIVSSQIQLTSRIVTSFNEYEFKDQVQRVKPLLISRFIEIAFYLKKFHNYSSLSQILSAVRGILGSSENENLTWKSIDFATVKMFVKLEPYVSPKENYAVYRESILDARHAIPLLQVHKSDISQLRVPIPPDREETQPLQQPMYFTTSRNHDAAVKIAEFYYLFSQK